MSDDSQKTDPVDTTVTTVAETEPQPSQKPTNFWQKLGTAVKNAVDCCLEN